MHKGANVTQSWFIQTEDELSVNMKNKEVTTQMKKTITSLQKQIWMREISKVVGLLKSGVWYIFKKHVDTERLENVKWPGWPRSTVLWRSGKQPKTPPHGPHKHGAGSDMVWTGTAANATGTLTFTVDFFIISNFFSKTVTWSMQPRQHWSGFRTSLSLSGTVKVQMQTGGCGSGGWAGRPLITGLSGRSQLLRSTCWSVLRKTLNPELLLVLYDCFALHQYVWMVNACVDKVLN